MKTYQFEDLPPYPNLNLSDEDRKNLPVLQIEEMSNLMPGLLHVEIEGGVWMLHPERISHGISHSRIAFRPKSKDNEIVWHQEVGGAYSQSLFIKTLEYTRRQNLDQDISQMLEKSEFDFYFNLLHSPLGTGKVYQKTVGKQFFSLRLEEGFVSLDVDHPNEEGSIPLLHLSYLTHLEEDNEFLPIPLYEGLGHPQKAFLAMCLEAQKIWELKPGIEAKKRRSARP